MAAKRWTEAIVFSKLSALFPAPAFVLLPQVRSGLGYGARRTADALVMSVWKSRGYYLAGVEIKVSHADWRQELKNPAKSQLLQDFCRYWYVAAPEGIVPVGEVPDTWGLIECGRSAKVVKKAPKLEAQEPTWSFVGAILRKVVEQTVPASEVRATIRTREQGIRKECRELERYELQELRRSVHEFEAASGVAIGRTPWVAGEIGQAVKLVKDGGLLQAREMAQTLHDLGTRIVEQTDAAIKELPTGPKAEASN